MSDVHLNNKNTHKEILHCQAQNIGISIFDDCTFNSSDLQYFEDDCYRHNNKKVAPNIITKREVDGRDHPNPNRSGESFKLK
jgi:hypothetical protein